MNTVKVSFLLAEHFAQGLADGAYERIGGMIRDAAMKEPLVWLREVFDATKPLLPGMLQPATVGILNLAISTMGFAVVMKRLTVIEQQLKQAQEALLVIDSKIDLSFYANFHAALDLAINAFTMTSTETRRVSATQAINRFLEAEHHYTKIADSHIDQGSQAASHYLSTLCLAYVTEARCYLELEETETAHRRLREGLTALRSRLHRHVNTLLTSNPAAYLHPSLKEQVSLKRLTRIFQWMNPAMNENELFESQRENFFRLERNTTQWVNSLPLAIKPPKAAAATVQNKGKWSDWARRNKSSLSDMITDLVTPSSTLSQIYLRLPEVLGNIETMIEDERRFDAYLSEIGTILQLGVSFQEWRQLTPIPGSPGSEGGLMYITLQQ